MIVFAALATALGLVKMTTVRSGSSAPQSQRSQKVLEAAVAGLFYPAEPSALAEMVSGFLAKADGKPVENIRALVSPHAGYPYSGPTAAYAYKQLTGRDIETVIIMGPSHYASFIGGAIPDADIWKTPLGDVQISSTAKKLAGERPFVINPKCEVSRPPWWTEAPKKAPPSGQDTPYTWEHSIEVQLPFLQRVLKNFSIIPIIYGEIDPGEAARVIVKYMDEKTILVASSDLSHYHPYDKAKELDTDCVKAICDLDIGRMRNEEACGKVPIMTVMYIAQMKGWKTALLDYRNSGDTSGNKSDGVVGYSAIAFYEPAHQSAKMKDPAPAEPAQNTKGSLTVEEKKFLLEMARKTLVSVVTTGKMPDVTATGLSGKLTELRGCFVTLTENNDLRGCIGHILPQEPLYMAVMDNARNAATEDPRFNPVVPTELNRIHIEISVLTVPEPLKFNSTKELIEKLRPGVDGVVLKSGYHQATYLPQVWEQLPDKETFLNQLSIKAGGSPWMWKSPGVEVQIYHAEAFEEPKK